MAKLPYNTDELLKQSQAMLDQTKQQGATPFAGSTFNAPYVPTVNTPQTNVDTLGTGKTPVIPPATPVGAVDYGAITSSLGTQTPPTDAPVPEKPPVEPTPEAQATGWRERIGKLYEEITGKSSFEQSQLETAGIPQQEKDVQELTNQLNQIQTEAKQIQIAAPGELAKQGISAGAIGGLTNEQLKENALKALTVSAQLEAKRGNLTLAYSQVDRAVKLKYEPLEKELEAKEKQLELLERYVLTPAEEKRKEELQQKLADDKVKLAEEKAKDTAFDKSVADAIANQMPNTVTSQVRELYNAGREDEARQLMAQYNKGSQESIAKTTAPKLTQAEELKSDIVDMSKVLISYTGQDGYINPKDYLNMKREWVNAGNSSESFDKSFSIYRNPKDKYQLD